METVYPVKNAQLSYEMANCPNTDLNSHFTTCRKCTWILKRIFPCSVSIIVPLINIPVQELSWLCTVITLDSSNCTISSHPLLARFINGVFHLRSSVMWRASSVSDVSGEQIAVTWAYHWYRDQWSLLINCVCLLRWRQQRARFIILEG